MDREDGATEATAVAGSGEGERTPERRGFDPWLAACLALAFLLDVYQLHWGLPNGNDSWGADALGPITVLGIVRRSFTQWNSGWYFFKYPPGYPFCLAAVFSPYLLYLRLSGQWAHPVAHSPYGFADPERALFVLAMLGRCLSVAFALGVVAVAYGIGRRLFGITAGRLAAFFVATAYPIIYYAHTTNLDIGYLFWLVLALHAALVAAEGDRVLPWAVLGVAAAMAVSFKEQGFAWLLPLPVLVLAARMRASGSVRVLWSRPAWAMAFAAIATAVVANNVFFNPVGFAARIAFLLGRPLEPTTARLAPVEFAFWKGGKEWVYLTQLWDCLESSLGGPLLLLALGALVLLWRRPRAALWLLVPALSHYYVSLRGLDLIRLRYVLPLSVLAAILAAALLADAYEANDGRLWRGAVRVAAAVFCVFSLARAAELEWLFLTDSRYQAEAWIAANLPPQATAEYYQKATYLPRWRRRAGRAERIPMPERTVAAFARRRPDVVLLSSASRQSIAQIWNPDWRETRNLLKPVPAAQRFLEALQSGELGYRRAATLRQSTRLLRLEITSLAPEITIYVRSH
jgi:4-amino-4-deoxy-L-arabinose transferase-like glycosyltransferase